MTIFDDRKRAFEQMFIHDEEARFRALALRNKLLGEWAAEKLGITGEDAIAYVDEIKKSIVAAAMDEGLVRKIHADFERNGVSGSEEEIREKMAELMSKATAQVRSHEWKTGL